jgi:hypothetical protein
VSEFENVFIHSQCKYMTRCVEHVVMATAADTVTVTVLITVAAMFTLAFNVTAMVTLRNCRLCIQMWRNIQELLHTIWCEI